MPPGDPTPGISIDLNKYNELVTKNAITLQRLGPQTYQLIMKRYDPATGEELPPGVMPVGKDAITGSMERIDAEITNLQTAKDNLTTLIADIDAMEAAGTTVP